MRVWVELELVAVMRESENRQGLARKLGDKIKDSLRLFSLDFDLPI